MRETKLIDVYNIYTYIYVCALFNVYEFYTIIYILDDAHTRETRE